MACRLSEKEHKAVEEAEGIWKFWVNKNNVHIGMFPSLLFELSIISYSINGRHPFGF